MLREEKKKYERKKLVVVPTLDDNTGPKSPVRFFLDQNQERKKCNASFRVVYIPLKWLFSGGLKGGTSFKNINKQRWLKIRHFSFGVGRV